MDFSKQRAPRVVRHDGTIVPTGFEDFIDLMGKIANVHHQRTQTVFEDENGPFVTIMREGTNNRQLALKFNRSRGWRPTTMLPEIRTERWHTGDLKLVMPQTAISAGYQMCLEWKHAKLFHVATSDEQNTRRRR